MLYGIEKSEETGGWGDRMKVNLKTKRLFTVRLEDHVVRDLKLLSVDLDKPISDLLAEAVTDLVRKHGRTQVTYSSTAAEAKKSRK
jgi:hypothetical protein